MSVLTLKTLEMLPRVWEPGPCFYEVYHYTLHVETVERPSQDCRHTSRNNYRYVKTNLELDTLTGFLAR